MNYLQLMKRLCQKVGGAGVPASVVGQTGEYLRYADWIDEAWIELQDIQQWSWMHGTINKPLSIGVQSYTATALGIADFSAWDMRDIKLYDGTIADQKFLRYVDYDMFNKAYRVGTSAIGRPTLVSKDKLNNLVFSPSPDKAYTVTVDYYKTPTHLINNADIPAIPERYHMAIVYLAMQYYGRFENANEVVQDGMYQFYQMMNRIEASELPELTMGQPLI